MSSNDLHAVQSRRKLLPASVSLSALSWANVVRAQQMGKPARLGFFHYLPRADLKRATKVIE